MDTTRTYSSYEASDMADISFRQLDYWTRLGIVAPARAAHGSGSRRRWSLQDVAVMAVLARVGGHVLIGRLGQLVAVLAEWDFDTWHGVSLLVDADGQVWLPEDSDGAPSVATMVNLGAVAAGVAERRYQLAA